MSLILDALKRAERERQAGPSSALEDLPASRAPRGRRRWGRWLALAVLALVALAVTVSVKRKPRMPPEIARPAAAAAPQQAAKPAPAPVPAPAPATPSATIQARPAPTVIPGTEGVASLDDLTPDSDVELVPAPAAPPPAIAAPGPEVATKAEPAPAEAEPEAEIRTEPAPPPASAPAQPSRPETAPRPVPPALTQQAPLRKLREMPPDYRADFPALTVEVHVFEPNRRFVMINGRRYREGERLAEGPQVVEIVRDGIVLEYRGERVLYTLGR